MFSKLFNKSSYSPENQQQESPKSQKNVGEGSSKSTKLNPWTLLHYGIPVTASILAVDRIQRLLAIGTLMEFDLGPNPFGLTGVYSVVSSRDGRIKVIGGDNIEALLVSPKPSPFKNLEFLQNQGYLVSVSNENEIQVWDLNKRGISSKLRWESNITAFSVISGTSFMYIGDEYGMVSMIKYDIGGRKLEFLPYYVPTDVIAEAAELSSGLSSVAAVLTQPSSYGKRVLIVYQNGLIVIWDVAEDCIILLRGNEDLQYKGELLAGGAEDKNVSVSDASDLELEDKEITAVCWASDDGSFLALGYVDGDITFWKLSTSDGRGGKAQEAQSSIVKLKLSSGSKRLPVIVLNWSSKGFQRDSCCQLFVYGGGEIGSEEVLSILSLDWSSGIEHMKCINRVDLKLGGSFADMILLSSAVKIDTGTSLLVLTNPAELQVYDDSRLSALITQQEKGTFVPSTHYTLPIPLSDPCMTVAMLGLIPKESRFSEILSKMNPASTLKAFNISAADASNWPLTGGVPNNVFEAQEYKVDRLYIAGYQDGSVRIWDATFPTFRLLSIPEPEVQGVNVSGVDAPVSALDFCSFSLNLAVGNECGMVRLFKVIENSEEKSLNVVTRTNKEVYNLEQQDWPRCIAMFSYLDSPVCTLQFADHGARLAVGFKCGRVAMLDTAAMTLMFLSDSLSSSPICSMVMNSDTDADNLTKLEGSQSTSMNNGLRWLLFVATKDSNLTVLDGTSGNVVSSKPILLRDQSNTISMYNIDNDYSRYKVSDKDQAPDSSQLYRDKDQKTSMEIADSTSSREEMSAECAFLENIPDNILILVCFNTALRLLSLNSQGCKSLQEVSLSNPCCWTAMLKKDGKDCGLILLYRTGVIEIRSLTNLEVLGESSLMSILRWSFTSKMENMVCSSGCGQLTLVNGVEFAVISLLSSQNDIRIWDSLPSLHDEVLAAAAADPSVLLSPITQKRQGETSGFLGGLLKGLKGDKQEQNEFLVEACSDHLTHLESIFSCPPFLKPSNNEDELMLNIDDINLDDIKLEVKPIEPSSSPPKNTKVEKQTLPKGGKEKEKLFEGTSVDSKPRARTPLEIRAKYKGEEDAAAAAARARDKLIERQEKLQLMSEHTQELQDNAQNFSSMAQQLARKMENRKWWRLR